MKSNKLLTIMIVILVAIILVGAILFVVYMQANKNAQKTEPTIDEILVASVDIPEITTNLADKRFVRLQLKIQTNSEDAAVELNKRLFQVNNIIIQELSETKQSDLEGKQGKIAFQNALKSQINELMQDGEIEHVYITSYIIP